MKIEEEIEHAELFVLYAKRTLHAIEMDHTQWVGLLHNGKKALEHLKVQLQTPVPEKPLTLADGGTVAGCEPSGYRSADCKKCKNWDTTVSERGHIRCRAGRELWSNNFHCPDFKPKEEGEG